MAALYRGPKKGYRLTAEDRLTLATALWGENGRTMTEREAGAVAWSMMMRYLLVRYRWMTEGWNFSRFMRSFSQPINPIWLDPNGAKCQKYPAHCTASKIARRRMLQSLTWSDVQRKSPDAAKYAQAFVDGNLMNPFAAEPVYDFSACSLIRKQNRPGDGINIGNNCFLRMQDLRPSEREDVVPGKVHVGLAAHRSAVGLIGLGAIFAGGIYAWRYYGF